MFADKKNRAVKFRKCDRSGEAEERVGVWSMFEFDVVEVIDEPMIYWRLCRIAMVVGNLKAFGSLKSEDCFEPNVQPLRS
jgi:hypothetical protein